MVKTPVILTDRGHIREVVDDGGNALLIEYGDVSALAVKIRGVLEDPAGAYELTERGFRSVQEKFGLSRYVREVEEFLEAAYSGYLMAVQRARPEEPRREGT